MKGTQLPSTHILRNVNNADKDFYPRKIPRLGGDEVFEIAVWRDHWEIWFPRVISHGAFSGNFMFDAIFAFVGLSTSREKME